MPGGLCSEGEIEIEEPESKANLESAASKFVSISCFDGSTALI